MGKFYVGVSGTARQVKKLYIGVNSVARKVKKLYVGVNGVARKVFGGGLEYYGTAENLTEKKKNLSATSVGTYALFSNGYITATLSLRLMPTICH